MAATVNRFDDISVLGIHERVCAAVVALDGHYVISELRHQLFTQFVYFLGDFKSHY